MELDELKNTWAAIDNRLKGNELLNKRLVQGMLSDKSNKSLNRLVTIEMVNILIVLPAFPLCFWFLNSGFVNVLFPKILFVVLIAFSIYEISWSSIKLIKYLLKIDFSKNIKDNMHYVNKFAIYYRKGKMINYFFIIPILSLLGILSYYQLKAPFHLWIFLVVCLTIGIIITNWTYKKVYDTNIQSIQKSLEELKELEEEAE
jgi:hypothetical protein